MSAQRLRDAATKLREAVEFTDVVMAAIPGGERMAAHVLPKMPRVAPLAILADKDVALALADWLDDIGLIWERAEFLADDDGDPISFGESIDSHALTLADTILGATA